MLKKFFALLLTAAAAVTMAGCSDYVMTEKDLAVQRSIEGYWAAEIGTPYNTYDEEGDLIKLFVVEFTSDFKYFVHECYIEEGYAMTYDPISYSFEDEKFKVNVEGVASYARISVSGDGQTMYWITDSGKDPYDRISEDHARALGIPEYDREQWSSQKAETESSGGAE